MNQPDSPYDLSTAPLIPAAEYVAAVAMHVSSVCVITTVLDGERFGLAATAVTSVSAEPPRLLVCVNRSGQTHEKIVRAGLFCVNVLTEAQDNIATAFAGMTGTRAERFTAGDWITLVSGAPVLADAAAAFDCRLADIYEQSTHSLLFGDVVASRHRPGEDTLLYGARRFRQLSKTIPAAGVEDE